MQEAMKSLRCCQQHEGTSWEIGLDVSNLNVTRDDSSKGEVGMFGIFCGPKECDELTIGPVAIGHLISELHLKVKSPKVSEAGELVPWENVTNSLDFIIAGAERCGTSSLHYNLFQHPVTLMWTWCLRFCFHLINGTRFLKVHNSSDVLAWLASSYLWWFIPKIAKNLPQEIEFTQGAVAEDYSLFMQGQRNKLVPTKALLQRHLALRTRGEDPKNLESDGEQAPRLMGLKNPVIVTYPLSYVAIAHMNVKMILILCEPRLVHIFFLWKKAKFCLTRWAPDPVINGVVTPINGLIIGFPWGDFTLVIGVISPKW